MAHHEQARRPRQHHADLLPSRAPELNPVENVWQYLRQNWLSNTVFENYDAIIDAACAAWRKLIAQPETITSIGMRDWAHVGQPL
jgi:transposase